MSKRIASDSADPDFVAGGHTIVLDGRFFTLGPVIMADERTGVIEYFPVDANGNFRFDPAVGCWVRASVTGQVRIYGEMARC